MSESNVPCDTQLRPLAGHDLHHSQPWHPHKDSMASEPSPTVSPESCSSSSSSSTAIPGDIRGGFGTSSGDSAASDEIHRTKAKAKGAAPSVDAGFPSEANLTCTCTVDAPALPTSAATSTHPPSDSPLAPTAASGGLKHHTAMFTPTPGCANKELSDVDSASAGSPPSQSSVPGELGPVGLAVFIVGPCSLLQARHHHHQSVWPPSVPLSCQCLPVPRLNPNINTTSKQRSHAQGVVCNNICDILAIHPKQCYRHSGSINKLGHSTLPSFQTAPSGASLCLWLQLPGGVHQRRFPAAAASYNSLHTSHPLGLYLLLTNPNTLACWVAWMFGVCTCNLNCRSVLHSYCS
mmetsp:Transcript_30287/g.85598  ORF Transcript_30287/g.85598 Transcript_30287/m.85598 type:complete len:349 (+) Transcript_30287:1020-2066(+)